MQLRIFSTDDAPTLQGPLAGQKIGHKLNPLKNLSSAIKVPARYFRVAGDCGG
jgi:hypothetical protein